MSQVGLPPISKSCSAVHETSIGMQNFTELYC